MNRQKKVLLLRFSSLGDVIIANFSVMKVKEKYPDWHITWLVDSAYASLIRSQPWVDAVIEWDRKKTGNVGFLKVLKEVRTSRFDILLDMHTTDRSSFFSLFSGIPLRYSYRYKFPFTHNRHSYDGLWDTKQRIPACPRYLFPLETSDRIRDLMKIKTERPSLTLAIGASYANKRWPVKNWIRFCLMSIKAGYSLYLVGDGADEISSALQIVSSVKSENLINLVGILSITELVQVVNETSVTISGDTGILHIARALGKPVIALLGPNVLEEQYMKSLSNVLYCKCPDLGCKNWHCEKMCLGSILECDVLESVNNIIGRG